MRILWDDSGASYTNKQQFLGNDGNYEGAIWHTWDYDNHSTLGIFPERFLTLGQWQGQREILNGANVNGNATIYCAFDFMNNYFNCPMDSAFKTIDTTYIYADTFEGGDVIVNTLKANDYYKDKQSYEVYATGWYKIMDSSISAGILTNGDTYGMVRLDTYYEGISDTIPANSYLIDMSLMSDGNPNLLLTSAIERARTIDKFTMVAGAGNGYVYVYVPSLNSCGGTCDKFDVYTTGVYNMPLLYPAIAETPLDTQFTKYLSGISDLIPTFERDAGYTNNIKYGNSNPYNSGGVTIGNEFQGYTPLLVKDFILSNLGGWQISGQGTTNISITSGYANSFYDYPYLRAGDILIDGNTGSQAQVIRIYNSTLLIADRVFPTTSYWLVNRNTQIWENYTNGSVSYMDSEGTLHLYKGLKINESSVNTTSELNNVFATITNLNSVNNNVIALNSSNTTTNNKITSLNTTINALNSSNATTNNKIDSLNITINALNSSNATTNLRVDSLNSTKAKIGSYNCTGGQLLQNVTSNISGIYGQCVVSTSSGGFSSDQATNKSSNVTFNNVNFTGFATLNTKAILSIANGCGCGGGMDDNAYLSTSGFENWNFSNHAGASINTLIDYNNNWNTTYSYYTVAVDGIYKTTVSYRTSDNPSPQYSYGIGAGCVNNAMEGALGCDNGRLSDANQDANGMYNEADGYYFLWLYANPSRQTKIPNERIEHYKKGDHIGVWYYSEQAEGVSDISLTIELLSAG